MKEKAIDTQVFEAWLGSLATRQHEFVERLRAGNSEVADRLVSAAAHRQEKLTYRRAEAALRAAEGTETTLDEKIAKARKSVREHALVATGANFIPVPYIDLGTVGATLLDLLTTVAADFEIELGRLETLVALGAASIEDGADHWVDMTVGSLLKHIPGVGHAAHATIAGLAAGALVWGVGEATVLTLAQIAEQGHGDFRSAFKAQYHLVAPNAMSGFKAVLPPPASRALGPS